MMAVACLDQPKLSTELQPTRISTLSPLIRFSPLSHSEQSQIPPWRFDLSTGAGSYPVGVHLILQLWKVHSDMRILNFESWTTATSLLSKRDKLSLVLFSERVNFWLEVR